jgi:hypothetical protein
MARPTKFTEHNRDKFVQAIAAGSFPEVAARFAGFSPASLYRYLRGTGAEHETFRNEVARAVAELELRLVGTLTRAGFSDPRWALAMLERRFGERWAKRADPEDALLDLVAPERPLADTVTLDRALIDELIPRLLEAGQRRRSGAPRDEPDVERFEDDEADSDDTEEEPLP